MTTKKTYGSITLEPGRHGSSGVFRIKAQPDVAMRVKRNFLRIRQDSTFMTLSVTDEVCRDLQWFLSRWPMTLDAAAEKVIHKGSRAYQKKEERVFHVLDGVAEHAALPLEPILPPRDYQRAAYDVALASRGLLLADDLGVGKTFTSLLSASNPAARPILVVTLTGQMPYQWVMELAKTFPTLRAHEVTRTKPYDLRDEEGYEPDVIVMNYPKLAGWADHLAGKVKTVIFDEVQELRREGTAKYEAARQVAAQADLRWGLSATPLYNYGGEMYSIISVLRPDLLGSHAEFAVEWCAGARGLDAKTRVANPEGLRAWLMDAGAFLRRRKGEVGLELPPVTMIEQYVDVDQSLADDAMDSVRDIARQIIDPSTSHRHRWTARGELDWKMRQITGVAKAKYVADFTRLVLESEEKVILTGWHRECWDIWGHRLADLSPVLYSGSETPAQKRRSFEAFRSGESRILMLSLRSGAGLDSLQESCSTVVFGELDWSPGVHKQVVGRVHRPGQENPTTAYFCTTDFGSDPYMMSVLDLKEMQSQMLVDPPDDEGSAVEEVHEGKTERLRELAEMLAKR